MVSFVTQAIKDSFIAKYVCTYKEVFLLYWHSVENDIKDIKMLLCYKNTKKATYLFTVCTVCLLLYFIPALYIFFNIVLLWTCIMSSMWKMRKTWV